MDCGLFLFSIVDWFFFLPLFPHQNSMGKEKGLSRRYLHVLLVSLFLLFSLFLRSLFLSLSPGSRPSLATAFNRSILSRRVDFANLTRPLRNDATTRTKIWIGMDKGDTLEKEDDGAGKKMIWSAVGFSYGLVRGGNHSTFLSIDYYPFLPLLLFCWNIIY